MGLPLKLKTVLRAITVSDGRREICWIRLSVMPSHRYSASSSFAALEKGSTARTRIPVSRGHSRQTPRPAATVAIVPPASQSTRRRVTPMTGVTAPEAFLDAGDRCRECLRRICFARAVPSISNLAQFGGKLPRIRVSIGRILGEAALDDLLYWRRDTGSDSLDGWRVVPG